jgi:hypothetical protein
VKSGERRLRLKVEVKVSDVGVQNNIGRDLLAREIGHCGAMTISL